MNNSPQRLVLVGDVPDCRNEQDFTIYTHDAEQAVYVYGGCRIGGSKATNSLHKLDVATCTWLKLELRHRISANVSDDDPLPSLVGAAVDVVTIEHGPMRGPYLILFGGCTDTKGTAQIVSIDLIRCTWEYVAMTGNPDMPGPRVRGSMVAMGNHFFVFGGVTNRYDKKYLSTFSAANFSGHSGSWLLCDHPLPPAFRSDLLPSIQAISVKGRDDIILMAGPSGYNGKTIDLSNPTMVTLDVNHFINTGQAKFSHLVISGGLPSTVKNYITWSTSGNGVTDDMIIAVQRDDNRYELHRLTFGDINKIDCLPLGRHLSRTGKYTRMVTAVGDRVYLIGQDGAPQLNIAFRIELS